MSNIGVLARQAVAKSAAPEGALILTQDDVVNLRMHKVMQWKDKSEIWSLKYGFPLLGTSNMLCNTYLNHLFRRNFLLHTRLSLLNALPTVILSSVFPPLTSSFLANTYFTRRLFMSTPTECTMCTELKTVAFHLLMGTLLPVCLVWPMNYLYAEHIGTYSCPNVRMLLQTSQTRKRFLAEMRHVFRETTRNARGPVLVCAAVQVLACSALFFVQQQQYRQYIEPLHFTWSEVQEIKQQTKQ